MSCGTRRRPIAPLAPATKTRMTVLLSSAGLSPGRRAGAVEGDSGFDEVQAAPVRMRWIVARSSALSISSSSSPSGPRRRRSDVHDIRSRIETIPSTRPPSTTGRWRKRPSIMIAIASGTLVPGDAVITCRLMRSETGVSGLHASGIARMRSRSEMTPTRSSLSMTTAAPVSRAIMRRAASAIVVSGDTASTSVAMRSASCIVRLCQEQHRLLEEALDRSEQASAFRPRRGTVVDRQRDGHDRPDQDSVVADDRPLDGGTDREDAGLGEIHHRAEARDPVHAEIRDREGPAFDLRLLQLACPRALGEVARLARDLAHALLLDVAQDGDDQ